MINKAWECPKCKIIHAPHVHCCHCHEHCHDVHHGHHDHCKKEEYKFCTKCISDARKLCSAYSSGIRVDLIAKYLHENFEHEGE